MIAQPFADPLLANPIRLGVGTIQYLARDLKPNKASPLTPLLELKADASTQNNKELNQLGIPNPGPGTAAPSPKGRLYRDALETLAHPEAQLLLTEVLEGEKPLSMRLLLGHGRAVVADIDTEGLSFSPPLPLGDFLKALSNRFENTPASQPAISLWPSQLKTLTFMFTSDTGTWGHEVTGADVLERLGKVQVSAADAEAAIGELAASGLVENRLPARIALTPAAAFWLDRLATGDMAELLLVSYDAQGNPAPSATQLRFVGKPRDRVTALTLGGDEVKRLTQGASPSEPTAVSFSVVSKDQLLPLIETFLGVPRS